jgi:hypothetical protein
MKRKIIYLKLLCGLRLSQLNFKHKAANKEKGLTAKREKVKV